MNRLLLVSSSDINSTYGGGQVYFKNIVEAFFGQDVQFEIACPGESKETVYQSKKVHYFNNAGDETSIWKLLTKIKPDVIHAHGFQAIFSKIGYELNIPVVITAHHGGIVCPAGSLLNHKDQICNVEACQKNCTPCVLKNIRWGEHAYPLLKAMPTNIGIKVGKAIHKLPFIPYISPVFGVPPSIENKAENWASIVNYSTCMIAPSDAIAEAMIRNGYPRDKIQVLPHGIPFPNMSRKAEKTAKDDTLKFFYLGRINRVKGIHILCEAFSKLSHDNELHIFGNAVTKQEKRYLNRLQKKYATDPKIKWRGVVARENVYKTITAMDIMVHPTICLEVFGLNIAEALALGIPVIATRCGGAEMQIEDGDNGLLVEPKNAEALALAMNTVIENECTFNVDKDQVVDIHHHVTDLKKVYEEVTH